MADIPNARGVFEFLDAFGTIPSPVRGGCSCPGFSATDSSFESTMCPCLASRRWTDATF
jgi:hypothetical protein